jgi:hypothetical protein
LPAGQSVPLVQVYLLCQALQENVVVAKAEEKKAGDLS